MTSMLETLQRDYFEHETHPWKLMRGNTHVQTGLRRAGFRA